jgi:hypothetical protein
MLRFVDIERGSMKDQELLSIADFIVILLRRFWIFLSVFVLVMALAVVYLAISKKTYRLEGTIYVGRFQEILLEEGEFVANKLTDYSFIKRALESRNIELDIPIKRLSRLIHTEVVNEIKKIDNVGIVKLTVEYKGKEKAYEIFKALSDQLIEDHGELLLESQVVFNRMIDQFKDNENELRENLKRDEEQLYANAQSPGNASVPSHLLLGHTVSEKRQFLKTLIKDRNYLVIESNSATKSYNTKLAAEPEIPDEHYKPKTLIVLVVALVFAGIAGILAAFGWHLFESEVKPKLRQT